MLSYIFDNKNLFTNSVLKENNKRKSKDDMKDQ